MPIGSLSSSGDVRLDSISAPSGSTLFSGQTLTTGPGGAASIALRDSTRMLLSREGRAAFSAEKITLERGAARFTTARDRVAVYAGGLRLLAVEGEGAIEASLRENGRVAVTTLSGSFQVIDPSGSELASARTGQTLLFGLAAQEPAQQPQSRSGGQAPGSGSEKRRSGGAQPGGASRKGSKTALYILLGAGGAGAALGIALSQQKRGS